jgi:hypothetical protein
MRLGHIAVSVASVGLLAVAGCSGGAAVESATPADGGAAASQHVEQPHDFTEAQLAFVERVKALGGHVHHPADPSQPDVPMLRVILNETAITNDDLAQLAGMDNVQTLNVESTAIGDAGLGHIVKLGTIRSLSLFNTRVSDAGLAHLGQLPHLESLDLSQTAVTDAGLEHVMALTSLTELRIRETEITDAGVASLREALPNCTIHH